MCLAVPMEIVEIIDESTAFVQGGTEKIQVNISLLDSPKTGDFAIVHAGFAIQVIDYEEAEERIKLFKEVEAVMKKEG